MAERVTKRRRLSPRDTEDGGLAGFATWDLEQAYERRTRRTRETKRDKLPVKTAEGWKEHRDETAAEGTEESDADGSVTGGSDEGKEEEFEKEVERKVQVQVAPREEIRQAQEELARIAGLIREDVEGQVGQGQLARLADIARTTSNVTVTRLAVAAQLAVYTDVIPGYRIRPLGRDEAGAGAKVSKDVRKLRTFEQALLAGYRDYVTALGEVGGGGRRGRVSGVAVACTTALLKAVPHFNLRNDLIAIVVKKLSGTGSVRRLGPDAEKCARAVEDVFRDDDEGHVSLELVAQLTRMMQAKHWLVHERVLNTFLHLRLLSDFTHNASPPTTTTTTAAADQQHPHHHDGSKKQSKKYREFRTKRERKVLREQKQVHKEMQEADAHVSYEQRDKNHAETLKLVFLAYFRILKARTPHLMPAVLEGLAKYSHLINQDFFGDVLEVLKDLITDAATPSAAGDDDIDTTTLPGNAPRETLLCITTAFALLQGQTDVAKSASALSLDLTFFTTHLYRLLLPLSLNPDLELSSSSTKTSHLPDPNHLPLPAPPKINLATTTVLLLRSLHAVLLPPTSPKSVPAFRIAAFTKQLMTASLHLPPKSAQAVLALLAEVTRVHGARVASLWMTEERRGDGVFDACAEAAEASHAFAATVWEGELLRLHFCDEVREGVRAVERRVAEARR
ncbi:nucleolar complex-associated protein 3-like [Teratosphaeria destructans]|uniref:Nucleolar complex-associated protein 3 n=1 Tax=Teratosphaeria destructans TaxID=418781 RepID=A0A9W7SRX6_9PEZI|nr:nucleolar complex-associated protein 3-like [Teratosphaeria destructans]